MLLIDQKIFRRAKKGIRNSPFNLILFQSLQKESLGAQDVFENKSKYLRQEFIFINSSLFIENEFLKLIKIGVLRREVDGQGLTSKVRITPTGRKVLESRADLFTKRISLIKKLITCLKYQLSPR
ncbi:Npun_F0494 family protein [Prochlorococcus marinus]|uniref:Npun_F0494 family protein n=1 Tax=Prochlorococcus marinus TaxID=1219 RepID=UPI0022B5678D|nr:Npun_F0494 family protein [Prochlorococcus marinus]